MKPQFVFFWPSGKAAEFKGETTVLELAIRENLPLNHSCGGMGTCGTCRVVVTSSLSELPARNSIEQEMAADRGFSEKERLACQLGAMDGLKVKIPRDED